MFFELNNITYAVKFSRINTTTYAELWWLEYGQLDCLNLLGVANLNPKDRFVKSTGRKVALASLLRRMNETSAGDVRPEFNLTREDRKAIWETYFKTHKK